MNTALFEYYYATRFAILALILLCAAGLTIFWLGRRRWQKQQKAFEQALTDCQSANLEQVQGILQSQVSHEYGKSLAYILNKSTETLTGLGSDQVSLRDKQNEIIATAESLKQHASNILALNSPQADKLKKELLDIRQLVESVLLELFPYAECQGVTLRTNLQDFEPIFLDPGLIALAIRNLMHNAIKYSPRGRVVEISLVGEENPAQSGKAVVLTVKDHGRGIPQAMRSQLFTLNWRDDGLVETGNGLGLYLTRKAARLQGGDTILVSSIPNEGSVFQLSLPYATAGEAAPEAEVQVKPARRKRVVLCWGLAIAGLLVLAALLFVLLKPPRTVQLISFHKDFGERYVSALDSQGGWELTQVQSPDACTQFRLIQRGDSVALLTCHGRFVTAPWRANPDPVTTEHNPLWKLGQDAHLGDCALFGMEKLLNGKVALRTCAGLVVTAGNGNWPGKMAWALVSETDKIQEWEEFRLAPSQ